MDLGLGHLLHRGVVVLEPVFGLFVLNVADVVPTIHHSHMILISQDNDETYHCGIEIVQVGFFFRGMHS